MKKNVPKKIWHSFLRIKANYKDIYSKVYCLQISELEWGNKSCLVKHYYSPWEFDKEAQFKATHLHGEL